MKDEEIDRILSKETDIAPSSGFATVVMDIVHSEASAPPPIPFPWKRALPGIGAWVVLLVYLGMEVLRAPAPAAASPPWLASRLLSAVLAALRAAGTYGIGWILL